MKSYRSGKDRRRKRWVRILTTFALAAGWPAASLAQAPVTPILTTTPAALGFSYQIGATTLPAVQSIQTKGPTGGLGYTVAVSGAPFNAAWLLVSQNVGKTPDSIKIQVNPTGLPAGSYAGTITLTATSGSPPPTATISVTLNVAASAPAISASPLTMAFNYITGNPVPAPSLTSAFVLSSNGAPLTATVAVTGAPWLKVTPTGQVSLAGLLNTLTVTADPTGLSPKVYTGTIKISAPNASNKSVSIAVTLTVAAAQTVVQSIWPGGLAQNSAQSIVTINGRSFYSNSTVAITNFTPQTTLSVTDGTSTATENLYLPVYSSAGQFRFNMVSPLPAGSVGTVYSQTLSTLGNSTPPLSYTVTGGMLPPGIGVIGNTLAGVPTQAGSYNFTLTVTDSATQPQTQFQNFKLTIYSVAPGSGPLRITMYPTVLPPGSTGVSYTAVTLTATGGTGGPYTWTTGGAGLPSGMALSSAGVLSGSPTGSTMSGSLTSSAVSPTAMLVTVPATYMTTPGIIDFAVTTPAPGGGTSNPARLTIYGPEPQITAVVNSASYLQGTMSPGDIITIFGVGLGPSNLSLFDPTSPPIPTNLPTGPGGTSVTIGGVAAPLLYVSATQIGAIVPYTVTGPSIQVVVTNGTLVSQAFPVTFAATNPGIYTTAASGTGQGAILNYNAATNDYTINSATTAATKGSTVVLYLTGAGVTTSPAFNQLIPGAPAAAVTPVAAPSVMIGGQGATVLAAVAPPGSVPGVIQMNVAVPANAPTGGAVPVVVTMGGVTSQAGVTMAIK